MKRVWDVDWYVRPCFGLNVTSDILHIPQPDVAGPAATKQLPLPVANEEYDVKAHHKLESQ